MPSDMKGSRLRPRVACAESGAESARPSSSSAIEAVIVDRLAIVIGFALAVSMRPDALEDNGKRDGTLQAASEDRVTGGVG